MGGGDDPYMEPEKLNVKVTKGESVTALLYPAPKRARKKTTIILGHGAGAGQFSGFMRMFAQGMSARGFDALTFNFLYMEQGRHVPDPKARLESTYLAVIEAALSNKKLKGNRLVIGGKSMGGRIASQVAAAFSNSDSAISKQKLREIEIDHLVFLGYPLHPPGRPDKMRDEHLKDIHAPMLFVQGARDAFGTPEEIRAVMKKRRFKATIYTIEGGDHSFKVPKSAGLPQPQVYENVMDEVARRIG
jgi:uncharacterized protein